MTWRAFLLGLALVVFMCWADVWAGISRGHGWTTEGHFSPATAFLLVVLVLVINLAISSVRRRWALKQAELMLIWCMLIIGAVFPTTGLFRLWLPVLGGPAYFAGRSDALWRDTSLAAAPAGLLLSKDPKSFAVVQFYEGGGEEARVPWRQWLPPMGHWLILLLCFYLAIFFMCAILRRQWVEREHLLFPLARLPIDFTEGSGEGRLLPNIFYEKAFLFGFIGATVFRLMRGIPVFVGHPPAWNIRFPLADILRDTPLREMYMANFDMWWDVIGLAYLVPADVSLSVWFFYLFGRVELQSAFWMGSTLNYNGSWSELLRWQMTGSYMAFTVGALYMTRRHLADVARKALWLPRAVDDSTEPVSFRVAFWGFLACCAGAMLWTAYYGRSIFLAVSLILTLMCIQFVHARLVSQGGLYESWILWSAPGAIHGLTGGHALRSVGAVVAYMQQGIMMHNVALAPAAIHCYRIGEIFKKGRKLILPAMVAAMLAALFVCSWTFLRESNIRGCLNFRDRWGNIGGPQGVFADAHQAMKFPEQVDRPRWLPFGMGIVLTGFVMFMRARFYWWPIHPIGLLNIGNWSADRMWLPFFLGWLTKMCLMKLASGRAVRQMRTFFIGFIMADSSMEVMKTITSALTGGKIAWW
jgi:hypothetical protein